MEQMNERLARQMLAAAEAGLNDMEAEKDRLLRMRSLFEEWLIAHGFSVETATGLVPLKAVVTFPEAIRRILREANGQPVHRRDMPDRAKAMGVKSKAKNPLPVVDTALRRLREYGEAENVGDGYWRLSRPAPAPVRPEPVPLVAGTAPREAAASSYNPAQHFRPFLNGEQEPAIEPQGPRSNPFLERGPFERG